MRLTDHPPARKTLRGAVVHDRLAMDLTLLSNERTFLAYVRTALAFAAAGAAILSRVFGTGASLTIVGWLLIALGVLIMIFGIVRFIQTRRALRGWWEPEGEGELPTGRE